MTIPFACTIRTACVGLSSRAATAYESDWKSGRVDWRSEVRSDQDLCVCYQRYMCTRSWP